MKFDLEDLRNAAMRTKRRRIGGGGIEARGNKSASTKATAATWSQTYPRLICLHNSTDEIRG